jgi:hypothetical protein
MGHGPLRSLRRQGHPPSAYPQEVAVFCRNRFLPKLLDLLRPDAGPAHCLRDMIDDPEVVTRDFKFDADFWMFGCH